MVEKKAVQKPTAGINKDPTSSAKAVKPSANELLGRFLQENRIVLMIDVLDKNLETTSGGGLIIGKPMVTAEFR